MTTIINTPGSNAGNEEAGSGWAVAVVILLAVIVVGGLIWFYARPQAPADNGSNGSANINISLPAPTGTTNP